MKRRLPALASLAVVSTLALSACGSSEPAPQPTEIPTVTAATPEPAPSATPTPTMTVDENANVVPVTPAPPRTEITLNDNGGIVEMTVNEVLPIAGLPQDDLTNAVFVEANQDKILQVKQRITGENGNQSDPTITALSPGVANIRVFDNDPTGNGQKELFAFTVHVQDFDGTSMTQELTGVAGLIATGTMRVGDATIAAQNAGYTVRLAEVDGVPQPATKDYDANRLNFTVNNGVVTGVTVG